MASVSQAEQRNPSSWWAKALVLAVVGGCTSLAPALTPAVAAEKTTKPRIQVNDVPGDYIQLETLWVPVVNRAGSNGYMGLVVRLWPGAETRLDACLTAPHVADALMVDFNRHPLERDVYENDKKLLARIQQVITAQGYDKAYKKIEAIHDFAAPDENSVMLTLTCR